MARLRIPNRTRRSTASQRQIDRDLRPSSRSHILFYPILHGKYTLRCRVHEERHDSWEVAAGLGGGGLNSISTFVLSDLVPLRSRGLWQGLGNVVYAAGLGLGGVVGGGISDVIGWRWAFLVLTSLTVISGCGMWWFLPGPCGEEKEPVLRRLRRIDLAGSAILTAALALLLWGLNFESDDDSCGN